MTTTPPGPQQPPEPDDPYWGGQEGPPGGVPPHGAPPPGPGQPPPHGRPSPGPPPAGPPPTGPQYPPQGPYTPPPGQPPHGGPPHGGPPHGGTPTGGFAQPGDPLVTTDIGGWWQRGMEIFQRSWRTIGALMLVGIFVPSLILGSTYSLTSEPMTATWDSGEYSFSAVGNVMPSFLIGLVVGYLTAVAWSGALRAAAKEAVGQKVSVGESFSYGFRRGLPLWGWGILAYLTVSIGLVLCVLPGLYFLVSLSLLAPAATFERRNPYGRSFKLVNSNFGGALGRLILAWLVVAVFGCVVNFIGGLLIAAFGTGLSGAGLAIVAILINAIVSLVMLLPAVWLVGIILVTYVWARSRTEPITAHALASQADQ